MTQTKTAVLFQTHFFNRWCLRAFRRITAGCPPWYQPVVLIRLDEDAPLPPLLRRVPHHVVRSSEMRTQDYPAKSNEEAWSLWAGGHTDLIALHWWRAQGEGVDRAWVIEYDVRYSGRWRDFFAAFEADETDLLAPGIVPWADDPAWYNWPSFRGPAQLPPAQQLRAFMPVYRASGALFRRMDAAYRAGWGGHCEATWPSIACHAGLRVADLGGHGRLTPEAYRGRFYSATPLDENLAPGTLVFKPPLYRPGSRRDMLWHPVKPFFWRLELREALRDIRRRAGIALRAGAAAAGISLPPALQEGAFEAAARRKRQAGVSSTASGATSTP